MKICLQSRNLGAVEKRKEASQVTGILGRKKDGKRRFSWMTKEPMCMRHLSTDAAEMKFIPASMKKLNELSGESDSGKDLKWTEAFRWVDIPVLSSVFQLSRCPTCKYGLSSWRKMTLPKWASLPCFCWSAGTLTVNYLRVFILRQKLKGREPSIWGKPKNSLGYKKHWHWPSSSCEIYWCDEYAQSNEWRLRLRPCCCREECCKGSLQKQYEKCCGRGEDLLWTSRRCDFWHWSFRGIQGVIFFFTYFVRV